LNGTYHYPDVIELDPIGGLDHSLTTGVTKSRMSLNNILDLTNQEREKKISSEINHYYLLAIGCASEGRRNLDIDGVDPGVDASTNVCNWNIGVDIGIPTILDLDTTVPFILKNHPLGTIVSLEDRTGHAIRVEGLISLDRAQRIGNSI
jgi:hypothetical protein